LISAEDGVAVYMRNAEDGKDAFGKSAAGDEVIIIVNASSDSRFVSLNLSKYGIESVRDTLSGELISDDHNLIMELHPLSYRIFTPERISDKCTKIQSI